MVLSDSLIKALGVLRSRIERCLQGHCRLFCLCQHGSIRKMCHLKRLHRSFLVHASCIDVFQLRHAAVTDLFAAGNHMASAAQAIQVIGFAHIV